ncbi:MAG: hypothetical protein K6F77_00580 [Lachnospiraceae bacterium]|nr:hypothetical protein [Lachnospiraceae bacterium]
MRIWFKFYKKGRLVKDNTVEDFSELNRTKKIFAAVDKVCMEEDLSHPTWLEKNIDEFKRSSKTRFTQDSFIDEIDFDFMEISVLEEDY